MYSTYMKTSKIHCLREWKRGEFDKNDIVIGLILIIKWFKEMLQNDYLMEKKILRILKKL